MEPYKDAHTPWEPDSINQVFSYVHIQSIDRDLLLHESVANLVLRGFRGNDLTYAILSMCQSADAVLAFVMEDSKDEN